MDEQDIIRWLKTYADQELTKPPYGYEDGVKDGKTLLARGVISALEGINKEGSD